ncbi:MAG TPA: cobalamin-dependent protein, partial [Vicinamibacteria bacterium]|nr:cobalamin-dependent protein [Vicinamibacteria bacterium]
MGGTRIGLIAVSGVRVYNERLLRLGVTLPGFVERAQVIASMPSLGLLTLAAVTPAWAEVTYLEQPDFDPVALGATEFDVVAVSSFTAKADVMYAIADFYRARGTTVVLGGLHATLLPEEAAAHADCVVVGEGELAWPRLLEDWRRGALRPRYRNAFREVDLGATPAPRYDLLDPARYNRLPVQTTRGCPLDCEFCAASKIFGGYKKKPVAAVARDLAAVSRLWPRPFVELADDNTFVDKRWARDLVRTLAAADVHWFTETDVSVAEDPELLDLL